MAGWSQLDFVNTHDAPYDDVRFLGTKKRSGAIFSKFQKATGEGKRPEVWRCPNYMLFGVTRITKNFVFFSLTEIWFQPERRWWFTQPSSLRDMKLYEGFQFMGILIGILRKIIRFFSDFPWMKSTIRFRAQFMEALPWWTWRNAWCGRGQDTLDGDSWKNNETACRWFQYVHTKHHKASSLGFWSKTSPYLSCISVGLKPPTRSKQKNPWISRQFPLRHSCICCRWNQRVPAMMRCSSA